MYYVRSILIPADKLIEISDSQTYIKSMHKLAVFDPVEVFSLCNYS